ncbi:MAG TPA: phosphomannomutase/phosphoglucomutase [Candidatus Nanopelagicaceae bacterium]|nr:phosphomannomutase/phosphoglucomutase [Candidatus Nanopelagicaceae bacterium]
MSGFEANLLDAVIKAYDIRGKVPQQLTTELAFAVGAAFVRLLGAHKGAVVVGEDMRPSSPSLAQAFADGVNSQGADVLRIGLASTDQLYFASGTLNLPGAMFTASHNPAEYNGIKLCRAGAAPVGQDSGLRPIRDELASGVPVWSGPTGKTLTRDILSDYATHLISLVDLANIRPLVVAVDAGNGMAGHTVPEVLSRLPVKVIPIYFELDGTFPNHEANPMDPANLRDLQAAVKANGADIGLAFDGDADRCFIVDEIGDIVSPSTLCCLIAKYELQKHRGAKIIHNLITSRAVPEVIIENGGTPVRTRVGHSFIKAEMAATGAVFGGEHSGHFYFADFWNADSGMLAALYAISALGNSTESLSKILKPYDRYVVSGEINSQVTDSQRSIERVKVEFEPRAGVTMDFLDGMTVSAEDWWFNLRASNTEPLLRLNAEAITEDEMHAISDEVLSLVRE